MLLPSCLAALSPVHVEGGHFVAEDGRVMMFRGINSVIKREPWYDSAMLDLTRCSKLLQNIKTIQVRSFLCHWKFAQV